MKAILFKYNLFYLKGIDVVLFCFFINLKEVFFFPRLMQIVLSVLLIKKTLVNFKHTSDLEMVYFISGAKIKKMVLFNMFVNFFYFSIVSSFLLFVELTTLDLILENVFVLTALTCNAFLVKYVIPFEKVEELLGVKDMIISIVFYSLVTLINIGISFPPVISIIITIIIFSYLITYYNRSLNYGDITQ
jgi:hypothetical protein